MTCEELFTFTKENKTRLVKHFQKNYLTHRKPFEEWGKADMARFSEYCELEKMLKERAARG